MIRLLSRDDSGALALHEFDGPQFPAYAILSHTWDQDNSKEVTYDDLEAGTAEHKPGYRKIDFCAKRVAEDGLKFFWIDTCCINRRSEPELSEAINSMFRWYQQATRCYVHLSDVSTQQDGEAIQPGEARQSTRSVWEPAVRQCRWFKRGWTLQELLAPKAVDFYTRDGERLGDRSSLETLIHEVTGIARKALRGDQLADFSTGEKMAWAEHRSTKREEDEIYSLLGLFGVTMPLVYGEGRNNALRRLRKEIDESSAAPETKGYTVGRDLSRVPIAAKFIARERELSDIHRLLYGHDIRSVAILHGLGGMGKTQLSIAYMNRHKKQYSAMFWVDANDEDALKLSFVAIARDILRQHPSTEELTGIDLEGDPMRTVEAVVMWLSIPRNTQWLVVYDNYDNPKLPGRTDPDAVDIQRYLPQCDHGSILITTRSSQVSIGPRIHIKKLLDVREGLAILSNTSGRKAIEDDPAAIALVEELDGLPLALSTAGAYLEKVTTSFTEYHRLYEASWRDLQRTTPQLDSYKDRSLYTTWQLSLDQIEDRDEFAAKLLKLWAYFDRQDVWYELLQGGDSSEWLQDLTEDITTFDRTMRLLCSYGLVDPESSEKKTIGSMGYSLHTCVHAWTISVVNKEWDQELARLALDCVASIVPLSNEKEWWLTQTRVLRHATKCTGFINDKRLDTSGMEWALGTFGNLYTNQGKLREAEAMYVQALQGMVEELGPEHIATLDTIHNLGSLYDDQGKLEEAEAMYIRALRGKEEALGPKHTSTLDTVHNLGILYSNQGNLKKAEAMYIRALEGKEEAHGPKNTSTLETVNNLGIMYTSQGKLKKAEAMYIRALEGKEEALGPKHTLTLSTVHNLGILYANQGKVKEAEAMYLRALQGKEEALGPRHTTTLEVVNNLGLLYTNQKRFKEAEAMYLRALQGCEEALGPKHSLTLDTVKSIGDLYGELGRLDEAEAMFKRALQGYEEELGVTRTNSHLPALNTMWNLGMLYDKSNRKQDAKAIYLRALPGFAALNGPSSEDCRELERRLKVLETSIGHKKRRSKVKIEDQRPGLRSRIKASLGRLKI